MQLHELPKFKTKRVQRIARGGKRGTYSGRGVKGQKSRSGRRIRPAQRDLILRLPKRRGFKNKPKSDKPWIVNVGELEKILLHVDAAKNAVIDRAALVAAGAISGTYRGRIKILGNGEIKHPLTLRGFQVSQSAKVKIEKVGGKIA